MTAPVSATHMPAVEPRSNHPRGGHKGGEVFALAIEKAAANAGSPNQRMPAEPPPASGGDTLARHLGLLGQSALRIPRDEAGAAGQPPKNLADRLDAGDEPASRPARHLELAPAGKPAVEEDADPKEAEKAADSDTTVVTEDGDASEPVAGPADEQPAPREPWQAAMENAIQFLRAEPAVPANKASATSAAGETAPQQPDASANGEASHTVPGQSSNRPAEDHPAEAKNVDQGSQPLSRPGAEAAGTAAKPGPGQAVDAGQQGGSASADHRQTTARGQVAGTPQEPVTDAKNSASAPAASAAAQQNDPASAKPRPDAVSAGTASARDAAVIAQAGATVSVATGPSVQQRPTRTDPSVEKNSLPNPRHAQEAPIAGTNRPADEDAGDSFEPFAPQADGEEPDQPATGQRPAADATTAAATAVASAQPATPAPLAGPGATVLAAIRAEPTWAAYFRSAQQSSPGEVTSLKIHLAPAQLGNVIAHLKVEDESVSVELTAETIEAQQRLTADADTIVRSLRAIGIEVERVTVQIATPADAARGDAGAEQRREGFAPDGQAGDARDQSGGSRQGQRYASESQRGGPDLPGQPDRSGSARYI